MVDETVQYSACLARISVLSTITRIENVNVTHLIIAFDPYTQLWFPYEEEKDE